MRFYRYQINQSPDHFCLCNIATSCPKEYPYVYGEPNPCSKYGCCQFKPLKFPSEPFGSCMGKTKACPAKPCRDYTGKNNVILIVQI